MRRHARAVLAVCLAHARNVHDAEDAMQEVFLKAITKLDRLREPGKARSWLLQIARRTCIDRSRRRRKGQPLPHDLPAPVRRPDPRVEALHAAIAKLPEKHREAITLYYLDGRSCRAVAAALGVREAAVRQRLVRGRLMLHELLREDQR